MHFGQPRGWKRDTRNHQFQHCLADLMSSLNILLLWQEMMTKCRDSSESHATDSKCENVVLPVQTERTHMHGHVYSQTPRSIQNIKNLKISLNKRSSPAFFYSFLSSGIQRASRVGRGFAPGFCLCRGSYQGCPLPPQTFTELQTKHTLPAGRSLDQQSSCLCVGGRVFRIEGGSCAPNSKDFT